MRRRRTALLEPCRDLRSNPINCQAPSIQKQKRKKYLGWLDGRDGESREFSSGKKAVAKSDRDSGSILKHNQAHIVTSQWRCSSLLCIGSNLWNHVYFPLTIGIKSTTTWSRRRDVFFGAGFIPASPFSVPSPLLPNSLQIPSGITDLLISRLPLAVSSGILRARKIVLVFYGNGVRLPHPSNPANILKYTFIEFIGQA